MGLCELQTHQNPVQIMSENPGQNGEIRDDEQGHGDARLPASRADCGALLHAGRRPHKRSPRRLPPAPWICLNGLLGQGIWS